MKTTTQQETRSAPVPPTSRSGVAHRLAEAPALPVRHSTCLVSEGSARHVDCKHLRGVGNEQVTRPLGHVGSAATHGVLALDGLGQRTPFNSREAHKDASVTRKRLGRSTKAGHDLPISQSRRGAPLNNFAAQVRESRRRSAVGDAGSLSTQMINRTPYRGSGCVSQCRHGGVARTTDPHGDLSCCWNKPSRS